MANTVDKYCRYQGIRKIVKSKGYKQEKETD
jgi:hypothetical protein